jgi:signal transduction histidine kinase
MQDESAHTRSRFLSLMTHELRAPLNTINGYLDLALSEAAGELNPQLREFLQRARSSSEHLFSMIENLLLLSRAEAGKLHLKSAPVSLQDVLIDAIEEMEVTAQDKNITITTVIPDHFPQLYADADRLQHIIRNLLSNALRFTSKGGRVEIAAWIDGEPGRRVTMLRVSDTGPGMAREFHERIFEPFFQIPGSGSGGQGLGLAIVKILLELYGGSVQVNSTPGEGSSFLCEFPSILAQ